MSEYIKLKKTPISEQIKAKLTPTEEMKAFYNSYKLAITVFLFLVLIGFMFVKADFGTTLYNIEFIVNSVCILILVIMFIGEYYRSHKSFVLATLFGVPVFSTFLFPLVTGQFSGTNSILTNLTLTALFCGMALTLNLETGFLGLPNFGKTAFIAVGAYSFAMANIAFAKSIDSYTVVVMLATLVSMVMTGLFGIVLTLPTLRLREDYLAITTIVAGEILRLVLNNEDRLGGFEGFAVDNPVNITFYNYADQAMYGRFIGFLDFGLVLIALGISYFVYYRMQQRDIPHLPADRQELAAVNNGSNTFFLLGTLLIVMNYNHVFTQKPELGIDITVLLISAFLLLYRGFLNRFLKYWMALVGGAIIAFIDLVLGLFLDDTTKFEYVPWYTFLMAVGATVFVYIIVDLVYYSPFGRTLRAIREDETSAISVGKSVFGYRLNALIMSSALSGLMGSVYTMFLVVITPQNFLPLLTFTLYIIMIIGGTGNNKGVVYGALVVQLLYAATRSTVVYESPLIQALDLDAANIGLIIVGVTLIFFLIYAPEGIFAEKKYNNQRYYDMLYLNDEEDHDPLVKQLMKATGADLEHEEWIS